MLYSINRGAGWQTQLVFAMKESKSRACWFSILKDGKEFLVNEISEDDTHNPTFHEALHWTEDTNAVTTMNGTKGGKKSTRRSVYLYNILEGPLFGTPHVLTCVDVQLIYLARNEDASCLYFRCCNIDQKHPSFFCMASMRAILTIKARRLGDEMPWHVSLQYSIIPFLLYNGECGMWTYKQNVSALHSCDLLISDPSLINIWSKRVGLICNICHGYVQSCIREHTKIRIHFKYLM